MVVECCKNATDRTKSPKSIAKIFSAGAGDERHSSNTFTVAITVSTVLLLIPNHHLRSILQRGLRVLAVYLRVYALSNRYSHHTDHHVQ